MPPSRSCAAANCEGKKHLYGWPKGLLADVWTEFVRLKRHGKKGPWKPVQSSVLCFRHFTPDSFHNYAMYERMKGENIKYVTHNYHIKKVYQTIGWLIFFQHLKSAIVDFDDNTCYAILLIFQDWGIKVCVDA